MPLIGAILIAFIILFVMFPVQIGGAIVAIVALGWPFMLAGMCVLILWAAFKSM